MLVFFQSLLIQLLLCLQFVFFILLFYCFVSVNCIVCNSIVFVFSINHMGVNTFRYFQLIHHGYIIIIIHDYHDQDYHHITISLSLFSHGLVNHNRKLYYNSLIPTINSIQLEHELEKKQLQLSSRDRHVQNTDLWQRN